MAKYKVGVYLPSFCDQAYIRDRDLVIEAENEKEAISQWCVRMKNWIREDEKHLVKVLETIEK
jgi:hypothetical protein